MYDKKLKTRVQKFLVGLNDIHSQCRPLLYIHLTTVHMIGRPQIRMTTVGNTSERQYNSNKANNTAAFSNSNRNRRQLFCSNCQLPGHSKETCYKLHGYPPGHQLYRGGSSHNTKGNKHFTNKVTAVPCSAGNKNSSVESQLLGDLDLSSPSQLSQVQEQLSKLINLFNQQERKDEKQFHMAGPSQANYPGDW
ncbi:unnamed protein product [Rhodiola kirilowii]